MKLKNEGKTDVLETLTKERETDPKMLVSTWLQWVCFIILVLTFILTLFIDDVSEEIPYVQVGLIVFTVLSIPYKPYQGWIKKQVDALIKLVEDLFTGIFTLVAVVIVGGLILWGGWKLIVKVADWITPDEWSLMVCDEKFNDSECYSNSYVIHGFKSKKDCILEGATRFSKEGFECGSNCRNDYGIIEVCKEVCNKSGCNK